MPNHLNDNIKKLTLRTIEHYESHPRQFWEGTKDHDVSQNIQACLKHIEGEAPFRILDFGCGPGRDVKSFADLGHDATGLDGCPSFCQMARQHSGRNILCQNFIDLQLPAGSFDGIFANASLFHVPKALFSDVIQKLHAALDENGVLFSSNPRGKGEDISGSRYGYYMELDSYQPLIENCGFKLIEHYYRPQGQPVEQCPWLACVFRKLN